MAETISFAIRVVDEDGSPISGKEVYITQSGFGGSQGQYTDEDGWATFEFYCLRFYGTARVDGEACDIDMSDGETMSITTSR